MAINKYIIYKRVSTTKQGSDGYGMSAQDRDIDIFLDAQTNPIVIATYIEVESGNNAKRPELAKAVSLAKAQKATLLVSKLDRLSRRVSELSRLMEDVSIKVAMMPNADNFQLHIYASLAEQERLMISQRTKAALAAAKARGVAICVRHTPPTTEQNIALQASGVAGIIRKADEFANSMSGVIVPMRESGMSLQKIADKLNDLSLTTPRGKRFTSMAVKNVLDRVVLAA
ncbi:recombinase family protein [Shewanella sp. KT0246]|uniref:recombinase family protein n=1 Tax=Shewanella sp. KT0246 TaxID=2815912 RepID=UPI001BBA01AA|nr:recombinase family protein [Shewanella sp. KT0246]GIU50248.1 resolvase [Shewanella sp. KT0246]